MMDGEGFYSAALEHPNPAILAASPPINSTWFEAQWSMRESLESRLKRLRTGIWGTKLSTRELTT